MDCSLPHPSVHGIFQARVLEWGAISFSRGSSQPGDRTWVSCTVGRRFTVWATRKPWSTRESENESEVAQSCPTLCDLVNCSPPGSSVHGIFQAQILDWIAISFSRVFFWLRDQTCISFTGRWILYQLSYQGSLKLWYVHTVEYHSVRKRKEILTCSTTWMDPEIIILSEANQRKTHIIWYHL